MGWAFHGPEIDIWAIRDNANGRFYINAVSESGSKEQPPAFHGGVIADPMGLGKTLTMIALAATDLTKSIDSREMKDVHSSDSRSVSATLIVMPPPLHIIRNESSRMSRAMCALEAECRWAVTGTPIQNHLNDLAALLKFIRAHPYASRRQFEADISVYWKVGKAQEAAGRLQRLSSCLFLRRPKSTIQLPPRYNKEFPIDFTPQEWEEYDLIRNRATSAIDDALQQGHASQRSGAYANILQQIDTLRLFCGLGLHYHTRHDERSIASQHTVSWNSVAQKMFKLYLEMGSLQCSQCHATIDLTQTMFDDSNAGRSLFSRCLRFVCAECAAKLSKGGIAMPCGHTPSCLAAQVSTSIDAMDRAADEVQMATLPSQMPSKIVALISDLKSQPAGVKSVVFSSWRLTLNVVAAGLQQAGIQFLRYDGSIAQKTRHETLELFKTDPLTRVLLLTFSCGAVGLTLTEASRAYLLEPHWNPTIEEQALGRIYRIGQEKEVTTVRLFVRDSFETHVMNVQQSKKDLAQVILAPHDGGLADTSLERLQAKITLLAMKRFSHYN
ncbi:SNF2-related protein [Akanthomyces lecanii RCEF 1005]|uniref:SNF2-related protein n=1 Tax=Akanthomyces lecanii RCEF 1005 TaxID=1081108 RepID=A0A162MZ78_CORDF|nr:SNF2-related protein [Akanthomyces lecanii RCEF 1005]